MTILIISILSTGSKALNQAAGLLDWFRGLSEGEAIALLVACCSLVVIPLGLRFGDRITNFFQESRQENQETRKRRLAETRRMLAQRERDRAAFFNDPWDKKQAAFELKKYRRELERRNNPFEKRYMSGLSDEEIHQRIDHLEALKFDEKKKHSALSLADRRIAVRKLHDEGRKKDLQALPDAFLDDAERMEEVKEIHNFWNNKKRKALQDIGGAERNDNVNA
jgi:hypothetical protein